MNRRQLLRILLLTSIAIVGFLTWQRIRHGEQAPVSAVAPARPPRPSQTPQAPHQIGDESLSPAPLKKGARPFYGVLPTGVNNIDKLPMANRPTPRWKKLLEAQILRNGGERLKSAEIIPQESYVIPDGNSGRYVERVIIKVKGKSGEYTSFFAEVDSETGYVLKSWGAAIHERPRQTH